MGDGLQELLFIVLSMTISGNSNMYIAFKKFLQLLRLLEYEGDMDRHGQSVCPFG